MLSEEDDVTKFEMEVFVVGVSRLDTVGEGITAVDVVEIIKIVGVAESDTFGDKFIDTDFMGVDDKESDTE